MRDTPEESMQELKSKVALLTDRVSEMSGLVRDMADSMRKLILIEERQIEDRKAMGRSFERIDRLETMINDMRLASETLKNNTQKTGRWVDMGLSAAVVAVGAFIAKKVGLM